MNVPEIVVAGTGFSTMHACLHEVLPHQRIEMIEPATIYERGTAADILIPAMSRINGEMMDRVQGLRLIQQWGRGLEGVDIAAATQRGIAVAYVPSAGTGNAESVAEWCVMAAIAISRHLYEIQTALQVGGAWGGPQGRSLLGRTAGIVGMGGIGQALATRLKPFGMRLIGTRSRPDPELAERLGLEWLGGLDDLATLLRQSDYVFLCLPLNEHTRTLIDARALALLPPQACIINPGRGGLLSQDALLQALAEGRLLGAGLDVFEQEPLDPHSPLLGRSDVVATSHIAGVTDVASRGIAQKVADNVQRLQAGEALHDCVNAESI